MAKNKFLLNAPDTMSVEHYLDKLSLEDSVFADSIATFNNVVPKLIDEVSQVATNIKTNLLGVFSLKKDLVSKHQKVARQLSTIKFSEIEELLISVPEGFSGDLVEYVNVLTGISSKLYSEVHETLQDYHVIISSFITNKEDQTSIKDYTYFFNRVSGYGAAVTDKLQKFFPESSTASKAYLKNVISRVADLETLYEETLKLESTHNTANLKDIEAGLSKLLATLEILHKQMASQDITKVSAKAALNISKGAYELANLLRVMSAFNFQCSVTINTVSNIFTKLDK